MSSVAAYSVTPTYTDIKYVAKEKFQKSLQISKVMSNFAPLSQK